MATLGISLASLVASAPSAAQSITQKLGAPHGRAVSTMQTMASSATAAASSSGLVGSKIDIKV
jgi:hypothetical protein